MRGSLEEGFPSRFGPRDPTVRKGGFTPAHSPSVGWDGTRRAPRWISGRCPALGDERADLARGRTVGDTVSLSEPCSSHLGSGNSRSHVERRELRGCRGSCPTRGAAVFTWFCSSVCHVRWDRPEPTGWPPSELFSQPAGGPPRGGVCVSNCGSRRAALGLACTRDQVGLAQWAVTCPDLTRSGPRASGLRPCIAERGTGP